MATTFHFLGGDMKMLGSQARVPVHLLLKIGEPGVMRSLAVMIPRNGSNLEAFPFQIQQAGMHLHHVLLTFWRMVCHGERPGLVKTVGSEKFHPWHIICSNKKVRKTANTLNR